MASNATDNHLVTQFKAGSMDAMEQSFLMSNITPQKQHFNAGIWNELELNVRDWAYKNNRLFVVTGPVLDKRVYTYIGRDNKVAVPERFYKVILDADDPDIKAVGFIIPNEISEKPLSDYMVPVDEVEALTGLDFFGSLLSKPLQDRVEANFIPSDWPLPEKRFNERINRWNKY